MILCDEETQRLLKIYTSHISKFVMTYEWITDAYVSDFFFKDHWKKLPDSWQTALASVSTVELSSLLDEGEIRTRQVLPLSLMSFAVCTKTFSADRRCPPDFVAAFKTIFHASQNAAVSQLKASQTVAGSKKVDHRDGDVSKEDGEGNLHAFFRKHVKPKKQHEIQNLSKVIHLLAQHTGCESVVDVGAGLGHLSRLLSFGYGLNVTSVEAAGSHAPKANKFDREIDRELKKKQRKKQRAAGEVESADMKSCLPCHVTSMIYPDTTLIDFLAIVNSQRQTDLVASSTNSEDNHSNHLHEKDSGLSEKIVSHIDNLNRTEMQTGLSESSIGRATEVSDSSANNNPGIAQIENHSQMTVDGCRCISVKSNDTKQETREIYCDNLKRHQTTDNCDIQCKCAKKSNNANCGLPTHGQAEDKLVVDRGKPTEYTKSKVLELEGSATNDTYCNCMNIFVDKTAAENNSKEFALPDSPSSFKDKSFDKLCKAGLKQKEQEDSKSTENDNQESVDCVQKEIFEETGFILTGLHACGDLTPTFLRFFVNCEAAKGLASVGCCYMKISDESIDMKVAGYPMSEAICCLPNHRLSYNARELACHFADTYSQRLKDCPVHLKIHSYRAALEWLINQMCPDIKRTSVQIPAKKADHMDFKKYAFVGLQKLSIPADNLTDDLLTKATALTERWRDVVAFYTLRLAMAPVVETLILLDRMFYLYENGYSSALMPIFDSKLSPRNFVLLSWKQNT